MWITFDLHSPATDPFVLEGYRLGLAFGLDAFDLDPLSMMPATWLPAPDTFGLVDLAPT